jgi:hypothetical protein
LIAYVLPGATVLWGEWLALTMHRHFLGSHPTRQRFPL